MTVIGWSGANKLGWSKFKEIPEAPSDSGHDAAETSAGITYETGAQGLVVKVEFYNNSWVVKGKKSAALLKHEQGHWDIFGLYGFEVNRKLKGVSPDDAQSVFDAIYADCMTVQYQYDDETDHGLKVSKQLDWDKKIATEIRKGYGLIKP